jgi:putative two-component system response regulator
LLANRTNLTVEEQKSLALGAFLHDIGKVGKETYRFADDEIVATNTTHELRSHPEIGAKLVAPLGLPAATGQIIAYHHERWDGTGYPHGLRGEGIPILARIVCLAQTFDHLTAELPDRIALPIDDASSFIAARAGSYFDPQLRNARPHCRPWPLPPAPRPARTSRPLLGSALQFCVPRNDLF